MGHRVVKRVPMDFDAPLNKVWEGYRMPDEIRPPECSACEGTGYSPTARWLGHTFYDHNVAGEHRGWHDKLTQEDVDALVEGDRLRELRKVPENERCGAPCDDAPEGAVWKGEPCGRFKGHDHAHHPRPSEWVRVPRTADEVNAAQREGAFMGDLSIDAISLWIMVESRCKRLGVSNLCDECDGHGYLGTDAEREAYDKWTGHEPPEGDGWQLWETTTEGSPQSPVFATADELAEWAAHNATVFGSMTATKAEWLKSFNAGTTSVDSLLVQTGNQPATVPMRG